MTLAALAAPAVAQEYILVPLGDISASDQEIICFGINNNDEVVGLMRASGTAPFEAIVWDQTNGLRRIDTITSFTNNASNPPSTDGTVAFDINDAGIAVGRYHDAGSFTTDAMAWDIGAGSSAVITDGQGNSYFNAFSINNDSPAQVVGGIGEWYEYRFAAGLPGATYSVAFIYTVGGSASALPLTSPLTGVGFGISDAVGSGGLIAGLRSCDLSPPQLCSNFTCDDDTDGAYWSNPSGNAQELKRAGPQSGESAFIVGHAVNDNGIFIDQDHNTQALVVGFGHDPDDTTGCRTLPYAWTNGPNATPTQLPLLVNEPEQSELALDVRDKLANGDVDVVGRNITLPAALRWRYDASASSWSTVDLSDKIACLCEFDNLEAATAINDDGWIVVWGETTDSPPKYRSAVLVPCDEYRDSGLCAADLAGDPTECPNGAVDVFDLFVLLANWGTNGDGAALADPTNTVDVFDLFVLLGDWGSCFGCASTCPVNSLETELTNAGLTTDDWDEFEDVMVNSEDPEEKANYRCWMQRYLSGCTTCPTCPGKDPYQ